MDLDLSKHLQAIQVKDRETAAALRLVEDAINRLGRNTGASPLGDATPPAPIQNLSIKVAGELAHAVITDNNALKRNVNYFVEYANEPSFLQPYVEHLGTSRQRVISLPSNGDVPAGSPSGTIGTPNQWYFRAYSQYPGGPANKALNFGGTNPTAVAMQGATNLSLLPSTGSGTAAATGQQGGQGFGQFLRRGPIQPKRNVRT